MARLKVLLLSLIAIVTLATAVPVAQAQVVVRVGPRHRRYYHHPYHRHAYYRHGHRYYR